MGTGAKQAEISRRGRWLLLSFVAVAGLLWLLASSLMNAPRGLPVSPGIEVEDLGSGITIGMDVESAKLALKNLPGNVASLLLTREELASKDAYAERPAGRDYLLIVYGEREDAAADIVTGLNAYLAEPAESSLTLHRQSAAELGPDAIRELYGQPADVARAGDGIEHLTYWFADPEDKRSVFQLVTSHGPDGGCYAAALSKVSRPGQ